MADSRPFRSTERWYVVRTHPREETRVERNLQRSRIETFLPLMRVYRHRQPVAAPLFPQYVFARFDPATSFHNVSYTRGVQTIVRFGAQLGTVDDHVIELFRSRQDASGLIQIEEPLRPGERVTIEHGPFAALAGVLERRLSDRERALVLMTSVQASLRVEVPTNAVRRTPVLRPPTLVSSAAAVS